MVLGVAVTEVGAAGAGAMVKELALVAVPADVTTEMIPEAVKEG